MNKAELISAISTGADLSKIQSTKALDSFLEAVTSALVKGDNVALVGFGTFSISFREERNGRNPQTGAELTIPAANVPRFKAGKSLKDAVNS
jgi:DNA-binding protein HU-beta